ncbi:MAG: polysaccharide biosynthesis/export protein [Candidatus Cloacimonadota bacterium]|jgi:protein involved in polysaccharide export with SLBB domain|nr:polysaccharide biosynthesis/export protein [Candidatus Cloacimonadota bacterium]
MKKFLGLLLIISISFGLFPQQNISSNIFQSSEMYNITVSGAVRSPGVYYMPPTSRVSQVIKRANAIPDSLLILEKQAKQKRRLSQNKLDEPSQRNIKLIRQADTTRIDLLRFKKLGANEQNPYLKDGDIVWVPKIDKTVSIWGQINEEGNYEMVPGDRVSDIVNLALGITDRAYTEQAYITRFVDSKNKTQKIVFNLEDALSNPHSQLDPKLKKDDRIFIRELPQYHEEYSVLIRGEVKFPGRYSIEENQTSLLEILKQSGGPTEDADLSNAYLQRRRNEDTIDPEFERLKKVPVEEMTELEYEYFKTKSREMRGKFSINFEQLWNLQDESYNILLKQDDYIYIPDKTVTVNVSGQVKNPGLITYIPKKNYMYYINQAGGFSWNARKSKIRIIRANTGEWLKPDDDTVVEIGDMVFIPEKPDIDYWELFKDGMLVISQIATVALVITNIIQN